MMVYLRAENWCIVFIKIRFLHVSWAYLLLRACDDERDSCSSNHGAFYGRLSRAHVKEQLKLLKGERSFSSSGAQKNRRRTNALDMSLDSNYILPGQAFPRRNCHV